MLLRNFRPCGKQRTPCVCRQGRPVYGLLDVPLLVSAIRGQNGVEVGVSRLRDAVCG